MGNTRPEHLVFGLGTGRCGTKTLASFLGLPHEGFHLPWIYQDDLFWEAVRRVELLRGDVGCYWLNYVEPLLELHPNSKFICLQRDREKTVRSWVRRMAGMQRFGIYVMYEDPSGLMHAPSMFPDYDGVSIEKAAGLYWDEYYRRARLLEERFRDQFRLFEMEAVFSNRRARKEMLRFAGLPELSKRIPHANKGGMIDSEFGNVLTEMMSKIMQEQQIRNKSRCMITPHKGNRLGVLAVKHGVSKNETDDIVFEFKTANRVSILGSASPSLSLEKGMIHA